MNKNEKKIIQREKRHTRIRGRISGTPERPRLVIYRSLNQIYAQIIDDSTGITLANASSLEKEYSEKKMKKSQKSEAVGQAIAKKAVEKGIKQVVFDRNGYRYHGRVKVLADSARKSELEI